MNEKTWWEVIGEIVIGDWFTQTGRGIIFIAVFLIWMKFGLWFASKLGLV